MACCISDKWLFEHSGIAWFKMYDETENNYFLCLDCCTWCLEFRCNKWSICEKGMNCYLCCCVLYFE